MSYPILQKDLELYPWRILIEHACEHCGGGFSSVKPSPRFCSHNCYMSASKDRLASAVRLLWEGKDFRQRIQSARKARGYPDKNRPEAVARRKLRSAAKRFVRKCLGLSGKSKSSGTMELLGYSVEEFRARIESLFRPGMSWLNYGDWEIDHIKAVSKFPTTAPISEVNSLSNLQPLWKLENRSKGARDVQL